MDKNVFYSNNLKINYSLFDFCVSFESQVPDQENPENISGVLKTDSIKVILSPQHFKVFAQLANNLSLIHI